MDFEPSPSYFSIESSDWLYPLGENCECPRIHYNKKNVLKWFINPLQELCCETIINSNHFKILIEELILKTHHRGLHERLLNTAIRYQSMELVTEILLIWPRADMVFLPCVIFSDITGHEDCDIVYFIFECFINAVKCKPLKCLRTLDFSNFSVWFDQLDKLFLTFGMYLDPIWTKADQNIKDDIDQEFYTVKIMPIQAKTELDELLSGVSFILNSRNAVIYMETQAAYLTMPLTAGYHAVSLPMLQESEKQTPETFNKIRIAMYPHLKDHNSVIARLLPEWCSRFHIFSLNLSKRNLRGIMKNVLTSFSGILENLKLVRCNLSSEDLEALCNYKNISRLRVLDLSENDFHGMEMELIKLIKLLENITSLSLRLCVLNEDTAKCILTALLLFHNLQFLDIGFNALSFEDIMGEIINLAKIEQLVMLRSTYQERDENYFRLLGWSAGELEEFLDMKMNDVRLTYWSNSKTFIKRVHVHMVLAT